MSELPDFLLKEFAMSTNDQSRKKTGFVLYGTVFIDDGDIFVMFDGAESLTPAATTVDVANNDRVILWHQNHKVIITGIIK